MLKMLVPPCDVMLYLSELTGAGSSPKVQVKLAMCEDVVQRRETEELI